MVKNFCAILLLMLCCFVVYANENWLKPPHANWHVNFDDAKAQAAKENKKILVIFCGSDWDAKSQKMMREVFAYKTFREDLEKNFVVLFIDSPMKKALHKEQIKHNNLMRKNLKVGNKTLCTVLLNNNGGKIQAIDNYTDAKTYKQIFDRFNKSTDDNDDEFDNEDEDETEEITTTPQPNKNWVQGPDKSWYVDFDMALAEAKKTGKKLYVLNTGSDWCGFCIKLRKDVLDNSKFKKLAAQNFILVYIDNPKRKPIPQDQRAHNAKVTKKLSFGGGVPSALILSPEGKTIGKIEGYSKEKDYLKRLKQFCK